MSDYFDLGSYTRQVTTGSARAQTWFTRGLLWAYGFNHEEAAACFERAAEADPGCVMAYWGLAYALGPNCNKPWEAFDPDEAFSSISRASAALAAAEERAERAAPVERALVGALTSRYPVAGPAVAELAAAGGGAARNAGYAGAMREVYRAYPGDLDVAALFADALGKREQAGIVKQQHHDRRRVRGRADRVVVLLPGRRRGQLGRHPVPADSSARPAA